MESSQLDKGLHILKECMNIYQTDGLDNEVPR